MSEGELAMVILGTAATIWGLAIFYRRHKRTMADAATTPVPHEVREKSHEVKNEVTSIRGGLQRIAQSRYPLDELVRAIQCRDNNNSRD